MSNKSPLTVGFIGDVALLDQKVSLAEGLPPLIANLEGPIGRDGPPAAGRINLWSNAETFSHQVAPSLLAVSLANNHVLDFGTAQLQHTQHQLIAQGIAFYGMSTTDDEIGGTVVEVGGRTLGLLGYACATTNAPFQTTEVGAVNHLDLERVRSAIGTMRSQGVDQVVVTPHWGVEQVELPRPADVLLARAMIDAGATAVIGHHAHCIQGYEIYNGRTIVYGLGSSLWPDMAVKSEFDSSGNSTADYRRRQRRWNRRALLATMDVSTGDVGIQETRFVSGQFLLSARSTERWNLTRKGDRLLDESVFRRVAFRHMLRDRVASAIQKGTLRRALNPRRVVRILRDVTRTIKD